MARLVLIDTSDQLPGLLGLHAWSALMSSELVLVGAADHPFYDHLQLADLRVEIVGEPSEGAALSRADLLGGLSPSDKRRATDVVDRARAAGEAAYVFGPGDDEQFTRTLGLEAARAGVEVEVVYFLLAPAGARLLTLVETMARLRGPGGCPWDREQTHASLGRYALEEVYELLDALERDDAEAVREELGDVLLQVVFHAQIAQEAGRFDVDDVAGALVDKLVRRHPHVFAGTDVADAEQVVANWEQLKAAEKPGRDGVFGDVPRAQPALAYTHALQSRAARAGFDWQADSDAAQRIRDELDEFLSASDDRERAHELGDLLMSAVGLARRHRIDPEGALRAAATRFRARFDAMAQAADRPLAELSRADWLALWDHVKATEALPR